MKEGLKFTQDYVVFKAKEQGIYPIPEREWARLKDRISRIYPPKKVYQFLSSLFFGVCITAIFTLIALESAANLSRWVLPTTWAILLSSFVLGWVLLALDKQQKEIIGSSTDDILREMESIEIGFYKEEIVAAAGSKEKESPGKTKDVLLKEAIAQIEDEMKRRSRRS